MKTINFILTFLLALGVVAGCASTKVTQRQQYSGERLSRPGQIVVHDFIASPNGVRSDSAIAGRTIAHSTPQTAEQIETGRQLGAQVAIELTQHIINMGIPSVRAANQPRMRINDIVIRGYLVSVDEGSTGQRMLIGFGSGAADLKTVVEGYQVTSQGLRLLGRGELDSGGGKAPGMLVGAATLAATGSPIGLIVGGASKIIGETKGSETIEGAAKRTAKEIADQLRVKFQQQGWI